MKYLIITIGLFIPSVLVSQDQLSKNEKILIDLYGIIHNERMNLEESINNLITVLNKYTNIIYKKKAYKFTFADANRLVSLKSQVDIDFYNLFQKLMVAFLKAKDYPEIHSQLTNLFYQINLNWQETNIGVANYILLLNQRINDLQIENSNFYKNYNTVEKKSTTIYSIINDFMAIIFRKLVG